MSLDNSDPIQEKENKKKQKNHFMQINPHINIINVTYYHTHLHLYRTILKNCIKVFMIIRKSASCLKGPFKRV